jgi:tetratricopeptide (TPR) repeat protein
LRPTRQLRIAALTASAVVAASLGVYAVTAARHPCWGDSAEFVTVAHTLGIAHPPGYPLYTLLSAVAVRMPLGSPFLRLSLLSALFASLAAGVVALTVWAVTRLGPLAGRPPTPTAPRVAASLLAGLSLAFAQTFWGQATVPEVYSLSALLVLTVLFLTCVWLGNERLQSGSPASPGAALPPPLRGDRPVLLIGLALGLALAHHLTAVLVVPPVLFALYCGYRRRPPARVVAAAFGLVCVGLSLYAYLPIRAADDPAVLWSTTDSLEGFLRHVSGESYSHLLFDAPIAVVGHKLWGFLRSVPGQVSWFVVVLSAAGAWALWRRAKVVLVLLAAEAALVIAHATNYRIRDIESYFIPAHAVLALLAGLGLFVVAAALARRGRRTRLIASAIALAVALAVPAAALTTGWRARDLSDRSDAAVYLSRMLDEIDPGGIVAAIEDNVVFLLWYARLVEERREDIAVIDFSSRAPHLEKWYPGLRFPDEQQLTRTLAESDSLADSEPTLEETRVATYLPLFVSLNASSRPIYLDPAVAAKRLPSRSVPHGLLARVIDGAVAEADSTGEASARVWRGYLETLRDPDDLDPTTARAYARALADQGSLWLARDRPQRAVALLQDAVRLAPDVAHIRNNLGAAYERSGRPDAGLSEYRRAIELDPGAAVSYRNVYVALRNRGEFERARGFLVTASRLDPENTDDVLELATLSEQLGRLEEAEALYDRAAGLAPGSWKVAAAYGDYLSRGGRHAAALDWYRRAEGGAPGSARAQRGIARSLWALGDADGAVIAMRRAAASAPGDAGASYDLAVMLVRTGRPDEALPALDDALDIDPRLWRARALKAGVLTDLGRVEEARPLFEEALRDGAGGPEFWRVWLNVERASGDSAAVRAVLDRMARAERGGE